MHEGGGGGGEGGGGWQGRGGAGVRMRTCVSVSTCCCVVRVCYTRVTHVLQSGFSTTLTTILSTPAFRRNPPQPVHI